jgi:hypothetical protein
MCECWLGRVLAGKSSHLLTTNAHTSHVHLLLTACTHAALLIAAPALGSSPLFVGVLPIAYFTFPFLRLQLIAPPTLGCMEEGG